MDGNEADTDLLAGRPDLVSALTLELTDTCNLSCRYCHQSLPNFVPARTITRKVLDEVLSFCRSHKLEEIDLTGGGELTMAPGWRETCSALMDMGIRLNVTSNLAKKLDDEDFAVLSRFNGLTVSLDSVDRKALAETRKGSDIRLILYNLLRVKAFAAKEGRKEPVIGFSSVLSAETIFGFPDLAATVVGLGATSLQVVDFVAYSAIEDNVHSVWELEGREAAAAMEALRAGLELVENSSTVLIIQPEIREKMQKSARRASSGNQGDEDTIRAVTFNNRTTFMEPATSGQTRDCSDPWSLLQIYGDGQVVSCCFASMRIGRVGKDGSVENILDGNRARRLRWELLTGEMNDLCRNCSFRPLIPLEEYRRKMSDKLGCDLTGVDYDSMPEAGAFDWKKAIGL